MREKEYHAKLDKSRQITRARSEKAEWFRGPLDLVKKSLQEVAGGTYYEFTGNFVPEGVKLLRAQNVTRVYNRTSPRLRLTAEEIDSLRTPTQKTEDVVRRLVQSIVAPRRSARFTAQVRKSPRLLELAGRNMF